MSEASATPPSPDTTTGSGHDHRQRPAAPSRVREGALIGLPAAALGIGLGELVAGFIAQTSGPVAVVGGTLIDHAPAPVKDLMISLFGTSDKLVLMVLIVVVAAALAVLLGALERARRAAGVLPMLAIGVVLAVLAVNRDGAGLLAWAPALVTGVAAAFVLGGLGRMLRLRAEAEAEAAPLPHELQDRSAGNRAHEPENAHRPSAGLSEQPSEQPDPQSLDALAARYDTAPAAALSRRSVITLAGTATVIGVLSAVGGSLARAGRASLAAVRSAIRLPAAKTAAPKIPSDAGLDVRGLSPLVTPNREFYRIDTALIVPRVDPREWQLRVHGLVEHEVTLTWDELLALPLTEAPVTLSCVSNEVGGGLVGNAVWLGYPIRELLQRAKPLPEADMVLSHSHDGFTASTPIEALTDGRDALLAVGMNGEPLPFEHGFPVRMVVPGLYGYVSATKWVVELEVTRFDRDRAYWSDRGWSERGPIKLQSRIDVPRAGERVEAGDTVIAGMAWLPHTGVGAVEVQIDGGAWQRAELGYEISTDTWVQWRLPWKATPGDHQIVCRAVDRDGNTQTSDIAPVVPDGATGWHVREVSVG